MGEPVLTKSDFVRRYVRGEFGNRVPTWASIEDLAASKYQGPIGIRNMIWASTMLYNIPANHLTDDPKLWDQKLRRTWFKDGYYLSATAPHDHGTYQGEVMLGPFGYNLTLARADVPMREAIRRGNYRSRIGLGDPYKVHHLSGLMAYHALHTYLCPNSFEWLGHLLQEYQDHAVEFTCFDIEWGMIPGFNTVFWEVRKY